jgi:hypothetical protein
MVGSNYSGLYLWWAVPMVGCTMLGCAYGGLYLWWLVTMACNVYILCLLSLVSTVNLK